MNPPCAHLAEIPAGPLTEGGCEECLAVGDTWVHLRMCLECGKVGCCESSKNRHASRHARDVGHPAVRSKEPGENWAWCYVDSVALRW